MSLLYRPRILRASSAVRALVAETCLSPRDFIVPLFVREGVHQKEEIAAMPGYFRFSLDTLKQEVKELWSRGLQSVLLFVKVSDQLKDNTGKEAVNPDGLMQRAIKEIKNTCSDMLVMTDVALDPYSTYGHDGIIQEGKILNDATVAILAEMSVSHSLAGADFVAPSDMMDGRVLSIRKALESAGQTHCGIMSYSAKYASCLYGPFREALDSAPGFGDKKTYQMDARNAIEALKEALLDAKEGADILLVKPAGTYLDIIKTIKENVQLPVGAYQVSGEYAMIKHAVKAGIVKEEEMVSESLNAIKRAGADIIISYFAKDFTNYIT